jgi:spore coat protein U-like protein
MAKSNGTPRCARALLAIAALLLIPLDAAPSAAATSGSSLVRISAWVGQSCVVGSDALSVGLSIGAISIACTKGAAGVAVGIDNGANPKAGQRYLRGAVYGEFLAYDLFQDAGHTIPWTDAGHDYTVAAALARTAQVLDVYGVILKNQDVPLDNYSDTVVATIDY